MTEPFSPIARVVLVSRIEGEINRKQVNSSDLAEFRVEGVGLRINAWKEMAARVPAAGTLVMIEGSVRTRSYQYEGKDREAVEITASSIVPIALDDEEIPF